MNLRKLVLVSILLCSIVPMLFASSVFSQATTMTIVTTVQVPFTVSEVTPVSSSTETTTQLTVLSESWTQSGVGSHSCWIRRYDFQAEAGLPVTGTITADQQNTLVVYLLSDEQFSAWSKAQPSYCDPTNNNVRYLWSAGTESLPITQTNVQFTPSASGKFWFLIETYSNRNVGITLSLSTQNGQTATMVSYSTILSIGAFATTQMLSVASTLTQQPQQSGGLGDMSLPILGAVIVAIIAILGYFVMRRAKTRTPPLVKEKFCISCGTRLADTAKFCKKCGAQQP